MYLTAFLNMFEVGFFLFIYERGSSILEEFDF